MARAETIRDDVNEIADTINRLKKQVVSYQTKMCFSTRVPDLSQSLSQPFIHLIVGRLHLHQVRLLSIPLEHCGTWYLTQV